MHPKGRVYVNALDDARLLAVCLADCSPALQDEGRTLYGALSPELRPRLLQVLSRMEAECYLSKDDALE